MPIRVFNLSKKPTKELAEWVEANKGILAYKCGAFPKVPYTVEVPEDKAVEFKLIWSDMIADYDLIDL